MARTLRRACVIVLDSVGMGEMPDAPRYGDTGADTLGHIAQAMGGLHVPTLEGLGLGNVTRPTPLAGVQRVAHPRGSYGKMSERADGKDTTTGHWEMAGYVVPRPFSYYPKGFPPEILDRWCAEIGVSGVLGNKPASGTEIITELGEEHERTGKPIVYTSADSVFQVAAHESVVPLEKLYDWCRKARKILDEHNVARVIARPFVGQKGKYTRTYNRHDYSLVPSQPTVLDHLKAAGLPVVGVGKIPDIYADRGITEKVHTEGNADGINRTVELLKTREDGLIFTNLVDFDMMYGHRRDPKGYHQALLDFDKGLPRILEALREGDLLMITADHGNDPTFPGSDHTREYAPLICFAPSRKEGSDLGVRGSFADLGETLREGFGLQEKLPVGQSFLAQVL
ncbi:MAG: phosphopentomutase [Myxococcota bacterium]